MLSERSVEKTCQESGVQMSHNTGSVSSRPAWSTEQVLEQPGLHRKTLSRKSKTANEMTPPVSVRVVCEACACVCMCVCV